MRRKRTADEIIDEFNARHEAARAQKQGAARHVWAHLASPCEEAWAEDAYCRYVACHIGGGFFGRRTGCDLRFYANWGARGVLDRRATVLAGIDRFEKVLARIPELQGQPKPAPAPRTATVRPTPRPMKRRMRAKRLSLTPQGPGLKPETPGGTV